MERRRRAATGLRPVVDGDDRRAVDVEVAVAVRPRPRLPPQPPLYLHVEDEQPRRGVPLHDHGGVLLHGDAFADQERRPHGGDVVALVAGRERRVPGDLLAPVGGESVELVVVDADAIVGVARGGGDVQDSGEDVGVACGEVELQYRGILEVELGLGGSEEEEPDDEDGEEDEKDNDECACGEIEVQSAALAAAVLATVLDRHAGECASKRTEAVIENI